MISSMYAVIDLKFYISIKVGFLHRACHDVALVRIVHTSSGKNRWPRNSTRIVVSFWTKL